MTTLGKKNPVRTAVADRRVLRELQGASHQLTAAGGLAALSSDTLSSVAYG